MSSTVHILNFLFLIYQCTEEVWDKIFGVNVKSSFFLSKEALPPMEKRGKASIMFVSSVAGYLQNSAVINYKLDCATYQHHSVADFRMSVLVYRLILWGLTLRAKQLFYILILILI